MHWFARFIRSYARTGTKDIVDSLKKSHLIHLMGMQDVMIRYRRSKLGMFWITISIAIQILALGLIFGQIYGTSIREFLPFLSIGIILWNLSSTTLSNGCMVFINAKGMISQLDLPLSFYVFRTVWSTFLNFSHNVIILPVVFLLMQYPVSGIALLSIPGFLLFMLNIVWITMVLGIVSTRFRDMPLIVGSLLQICFYITPIIWMPQLMPQRVSMVLLDLNPFYHLLSVVRAPLMGCVPSCTNYFVCVGLLIVGALFSVYFLGKYKHRIAFWL